MKNKKLNVLVAVAFVLAVAVIIFVPRIGAKSQSFHLTVSVNNGETVLVDKQINPKGGQSLLAAMRTSVSGVVTDSSGFITGICGYLQDADAMTYWLYTVNGEFAQVGAGEYFPQKDDVIVFDLHAIE